MIEEQQTSAAQLNKPNQEQLESQIKEKKENAQENQVLCVYNENQNSQGLFKNFLNSQMYLSSLSLITIIFIIDWGKFDNLWRSLFIIIATLFFVSTSVDRLIISYIFYKEMKRNQSKVNNSMEFRLAKYLEEPTNLSRQSYYSFLTDVIKNRLIQYQRRKSTLKALIRLLFFHSLILVIIPQNQNQYKNENENRVEKEKRQAEELYALYALYFFCIISVILVLLDFGFFLHYCFEICQYNTLQNRLEIFKQKSIGRYKQTRKIQENDTEI